MSESILHLQMGGYGSLCFGAWCVLTLYCCNGLFHGDDGNVICTPRIKTHEQDS